MNIKRMICLLLCISLVVSIFPVQVLAVDESEKTEISVERDLDEEEQTLSIGELGGYLEGNALTTSNLFAERQFSWAGGTGFAAERGNNLIDKLKGINANVVGDNNATNGPDRKIINRNGSITWIQDKYFPTARGSVEDAFDVTTKLYKYLDGNGNPMQLEVPLDQHDSAVKLMREKIENNLKDNI